MIEQHAATTSGRGVFETSQAKASHLRQNNRDADIKPEHGGHILAGVYHVLAFLIPAFVFLLIFSEATAQDHPMDLTDLSLEKFLSLAIAPSNHDVNETFAQGSLQLGYQYTHTTMANYRDGSRRLGLEDVLSRFPVAPVGMEVDLHQLEARFVPMTNIAFTLTMPYLRQTTEHARRQGANFDLSSQGVSDLALISSINLFPNNGGQYVLDFGISLPTGSITTTGATPRGPDTKLPYPMQLGSGTYDFIGCFKFINQLGTWRFGLKTQSKLRTGLNKAHYGLGNRLHLSLWLSPKWSDWLTPVLNLNAMIWGKVQGADPDLDPSMAPVADPILHGGRRAEIRLQLTAAAPRGHLKGSQLSLEYGLPIYQSLHGPQLEAGRRCGLSWQWAFNP